MNIKNFKLMTLGESGLIRPAKFIPFDKDFVENKKVEELIPILEVDKIVIVIDETENKPIGILTWKDISKVFSSRNWIDIITKWQRVESVFPNDTIDSCLKKMSKTGYRAFPVVEDEKPIGVIRSQDLRNALVHKVNITF